MHLHLDAAAGGPELTRDREHLLRVRSARDHAMRARRPINRQSVWREEKSYRTTAERNVEKENKD